MRSSKNKPVTMKEVADRAGVSRTTVSLVLNNVANVNVPEKTRQRILDAVREMGYRPNTAARNVRRQRSDMIGLVTDEIATTPYAGQLIRGAQDEAWKNHKLINLINTNLDQDLEKQAVECFLELRVEGIIYASFYHRPVTPPENIYEAPTVLANCYIEDHSLPSVVPDEFKGAYDAVMTLVEAGHKEIGFINYSIDIPAKHKRMEGYLQALKDAGLSYNPEFVVCNMSEAWGGYDAAMQLFKTPRRPTGLFCFNDRMAMGVYDALHKLNLDIPHDVAIVSFDNQEIIAGSLHPGLSSMALPHYEMGKWAVEQVLRMTKNEETSAAPIQHLIECPLVKRASV